MNYSNQTINILRLIRSENITPRTFFEAIKFFGNIDTALSNIQEYSLKGGKSTPIKICSKAQAELEIEKLNKIGAKILTYVDNNYPKLLLHISDPPPILIYKGNINLLKEKILAIVGARNASAYGIIFTKKISNELSKIYNFTIISGLAKGIDTTAHEASLPNTIAVLAGGIDHVYPAQNQKLYQQISEEGLLLSELPIGSVALSQNFPQRNRLISGISLGVIITEAKEQSGSLITARLALDQGRDVFAVPGFPLDTKYSGCNKLLKQGCAHIILSTEDVLNNIPVLSTMEQKLFEKSVDLEEIIPDYKINDSMRSTIIDLISTTPIDIDTINYYANLPLPIIYGILLELELAGKILRYPGNKIGLLCQN